MIDPTRLTPYRPRDVAALLDSLTIGQCVAVVGLSNFGKSTLLRQMVDSSVATAYQHVTGRPVLFVFVDCNRMLQMSAQGFYEAILRAVLETLTGQDGDRALGDAIVTGPTHNNLRDLRVLLAE